MKGPFVSVVMGVYNGERYLSEALESILKQTYSNWECLIIDDCSTDRTQQILNRFRQKDARFKIYRNEKNQKLAFCLNRGIRMAEGKYIVRMDADDISRSDRLEQQIRFMEEHHDISLSCCKWFALEDEQVYPVSALRRCDPEMVKGLFLFFNPLNHSGVIAKREVIESFLYDQKYTCTEDLELWTRMLLKGEKIAIQDEFLLLYRMHEAQVTAMASQRQREEYQEIATRFYDDTLFTMSHEQKRFLTEHIYFRNIFSPEVFGRLYRDIRESNRPRCFFSPKAIKYAACEFLLIRRSHADNKQRLFYELLCLGPLSVMIELIRRMVQKITEGRKCAEALEIFNSEQRKAYGKKRLYWNV